MPKKWTVSWVYLPVTLDIPEAPAAKAQEPVWGRVLRRGQLLYVDDHDDDHDDDDDDYDDDDDDDSDDDDDDGDEILVMLAFMMFMLMMTTIFGHLYMRKVFEKAFVPKHCWYPLAI